MQDETTLKIFQKLGINKPQMLGRGGEGIVFALDAERVVKVFEKGNTEQLQAIQQFYQLLASFLLPYQTPQILEVDEVDGVIYTLEKRLYGKPLDQLFPQLTNDQKKIVLRNYLDAIKPFNSIIFHDWPYGQIIKTKKSVTDVTWKGFLVKKLSQTTEQPRLKKDVRNFGEKVRLMHKLIQTKLESPKKSLVHGDYYFSNVLVGDKLEISAVLDFGEHAIVGDKRMDVAGAISFLTAGQEATPEYIVFITDLAKATYGDDIEWFITFYNLFYSFYFFASSDEKLYQWCLTNLNNETKWKDVGFE